ncbi:MULTISPECIES: hypothetical protein [Streptomyces]|uniref:Uncharacterized protein n=1 Tax=Streptomyces griseocarneus TaxID=51201 RepID=A0ABX7RWW8_9ACTN|nr:MULTISPECIES: hypothetical protein [Streptomyces]QSY51414.1 hypothetical protein J3S04_11405 [Streptomyces griseocarneus]
MGPGVRRPPDWSVVSGEGTCPTRSGFACRYASSVARASDGFGIADFTLDSVDAACAIHSPALPLSSPSRNVALAMSAPHTRKASPASPSHRTCDT